MQAEGLLLQKILLSTPPGSETGGTTTPTKHQSQPPICPVHVGVSGDVERCAWTEGMGPSGHKQSYLRPRTPPAVGTQKVLGPGLI